MLADPHLSHGWDRKDDGKQPEKVIWKRSEQQVQPATAAAATAQASAPAARSPSLVFPKANGAADLSTAASSSLVSAKQQVQSPIYVAPQRQQSQLQQTQPIHITA